MKTVLASFALLFAACAHAPLDPGAGDNAGGGSKTLTVQGSAIAHPNVPDAAHPSDFTTEFEIRISLGQTQVTTGTVTLTSSGAKTDLTFNTNGNGRWQGTANGYDEVYQLDVTSGPDTISAVRVDGPGIHTISGPAEGASIDASMPNMLTWLRDAAAETAQLRIRDGGDGLTIADSGSFSIPALTFQASHDQTRNTTIQLTRTNQITPAGAVAGSSFSVGVENEIDVVLLACPTCP